MSRKTTTTMCDLLEKLKDPLLVWEFQYYFGIRKLGATEANRIHDSASSPSPSLTNCCLHVHDARTNDKKDDKIRSSCEMHGCCGSRYATGHVKDTKKVEESNDDDKKAGPSLASSESTEITSSSSSASSEDSDGAGANRAEASVRHRITRRFWFYLFTIGAALGDEAFYSSFFPFWFWNVDGAVFRRVVMIWVLIMYIGQGLKDVIRWPRPSSPPVVRLEEKWALEYGMPSTHAMVGGAVPFSFLFYTIYRYEYPVILGVVVCVLWCSLVCGSRLYLGMHTVLDIIGGLVLVTVLMVVLIPFIDSLDWFLLTSLASPLSVLVTSIFMIVFYPDAGHWTPARGDTIIILGVGAGVSWGSWLNYQMGIIRGPPMPPPYAIIWPTYEMAGLTLLRTCIGILIVVATRAILKSLSYAVACHLLKLDPKDVANRRNLTVEISSKFVTYSAVAFNITYLSPTVFRFLNIERVTMFTEV